MCENHINFTCKTVWKIHTASAFNLLSTNLTCKSYK